MNKDQEQITTALTDALEKVFGDGDSKDPDQMRILVRRIPILCTNIEQMHETLGKLDDYIKNDANWKKEFDMWKTKVVEPLIKKEADGKAVNTFVTHSAKYIAAVTAFLVSVVILYNYVIHPLLTK